MLFVLEEYGCQRVCDRTTPNKMVDIEKSKSPDLSFHTLSYRDFITFEKSLIFLEPVLIAFLLFPWKPIIYQLLSNIEHMFILLLL